MNWFENWMRKLEKKNRKNTKELKKIWEQILSPPGLKNPTPRRLLLPPLPSHKDFFQSKEWQKVRYQAIKKYGRLCMACGVKAQEIHVDHVKPRSKFPHLALELSNLQVLCRKCNIGKGNWDQTDWRRKK